MSGTKELLQTLLDREAIRDLPLRYCDCVWRNDIEGLVNLFARKGEFIFRSGDMEAGAQGHPALKAFYEKGLDIAPRPFIHNHVIELTGAKKASGRCYLDLRNGKDQMRFMGAGHYDDTYVKEKGEWKFGRRYFTALRIDENPVGEPAPAKTSRAPRRKSVAN